MKAILEESNLHFYSLSTLVSALNATESPALLQWQQFLGKLGQFKVSFHTGSGFRGLSEISPRLSGSLCPQRDLALDKEIRMHEELLFNAMQQLLTFFTEATQL